MFWSLTILLSTVLKAISWGLYGRVSGIKSNDHLIPTTFKSDKTEASVTLKLNNETFEVVRSIGSSSSLAIYKTDGVNKSEIKKAVKSLYGVSVLSVNIINVPAKPKRFKGKAGVKSGYRKAIVKLAKNSKIDLMKESK